MSDLSFDELFAAWMDGELDEAGCAQLLEILRAQPELRERAVKELMLVRTLRTLPVFQDADLGQEVAERIRLQDQPDPELTAGVLRQIQARVPVPTPVENQPQSAPFTPRPTRQTAPVAKKAADKKVDPTSTVMAVIGALAAIILIVGVTALIVVNGHKEAPVAETPIPPTKPEPTPEPEPAPEPPMVVEKVPEVPKPEPQPKPVSQVPEKLLLGEARHLGADAPSPWTKSPEFFAGAGELESGTLEVNLKNSVRLRIVGPAKWKSESLKQFDLLEGKLAAEVTPNAKGYQVNAHQLEVIDLGTRFAVSANTQDAAVLVYDGLVEAGAVGQTERKRLSSRQTAQVTDEAKRLEPLSPTVNVSEAFAKAPAWSGNIIKHVGVTVLEEAPTSLVKESYPSGQAVMFKERPRIVPGSDWKVNLKKPGDETGKGIDVEEYPLNATGRVSSYMFHYSGGRLKGYARFDSPVLGVVTEGGLLAAYDEDLGRMGSRYPDFNWRGVDQEDEVRIEPDGRTVSFNIGAPQVDQFRVFVLEEM